jgi:hypothetical protein
MNVDKPAAASAANDLVELLYRLDALPPEELAVVITQHLAYALGRSDAGYRDAAKPHRKVYDQYDAGRFDGQKEAARWLLNLTVEHRSDREGWCSGCGQSWPC